MYICVLDFEATCWKDKSGPGFEHEIIEFPSVLINYDENTGKITKLGEFQEFCNPKLNKTLSDFCTELTGITQDQVDKADSFLNVFKRHFQWLVETVPDFHNQKVYILTYGNWDLANVIKLEFKRWNIKSVPAIYKQFINIKTEAAKFYHCRKMGMDGLLKYLGMELIGRHHSGISDTRNITNIFQRMVEDGYNSELIKINIA
jgi:3'-5' exoribonuclease 1